MNLRPGTRGFLVLTKAVIWVLALLPFLHMLLGAFQLAGIDLGANPVELIQDTFGLWALRFLLLTLAVTPLKMYTGKLWLHAYRRLLGLFAFFYAALHLAVYLGLDLRFDFAHLWEDILKRPFITLGMAAIFLLLPLALTSTRGWIRRLGKRWQTLHRLVYVVAILAVWHFYWQVKLDTMEPLVYALILLVLLGMRWHLRRLRLQRRKLRH